MRTIPGRLGDRERRLRTPHMAIAAPTEEVSRVLAHRWVALADFVERNFRRGVLGGCIRRNMGIGIAAQSCHFERL